MKVMCITNKWFRNFDGTVPGPTYGEFLEVSKITNAGSAYNFEEYPHPGQPVLGWHKSGFIPLSDIDETKLVNEKWREPVSYLDAGFLPNSK